MRESFDEIERGDIIVRGNNEYRVMGVKEGEDPDDEEEDGTDGVVAYNDDGLGRKVTETKINESIESGVVEIKEGQE